MSLTKLLAHPLTQDMDIDDPLTTSVRREIIRSKPFLSKLYQEWYKRLAHDIPVGDGMVLELGSGAGFFKDIIPETITSEVFFLDSVDAVLDATQLPFRDAALKAIVMVDVLHHIPNSEAFLLEASRCLKPGGVISLIEPWVTPWSSVVYTHLHHEPFEPDVKQWEFPSCGPLSGANGALPWIICSRDSHVWDDLLPDLRVESITPDWPFSYLASGGVSMRSLSPGWSFSSWRFLEKLLSPLRTKLAMFAAITIRKNNS
ncbi:methyltransferase domain-containing protein [uncultured Pseudodesulfovibrio sp.]|uniref:methyltransferase domain-containing protein n=1 Tax=uncultured Pseudodesulfovibrio sp. TaxID=2035858 RepID=UPI0029C9B0BD|nr:methyltransferase domain-containing protein [uncultured Pseudodesulfovibrio sp.]